ncbi:lamin tail domain-containing protein [Actinoplanes sp. NPDC049316]|uniref:lamin tail domain-containing protein n=1 Tax=Actinoplanes sp. NPDC049316 TaxID=3154727 RepID=UPI0034129DAE
MRRSVSIIAAAVVAVAGSLASGGPASAATPSLRFHGAQYDSPGSDTRSNTSLNSEWISLVNSGSRAVNLSGYTVRDKSNHVYKFGNVTIAANGGRLWLHTGKGTNGAKDRYWGSGNYIWNNTGDTAYLRNASGKQLDTCTWGKKSGRTWVGC